jgi:hypothetical protein
LYEEQSTSVRGLADAMRLWTEFGRDSAPACIVVAQIDLQQDEGRDRLSLDARSMFSP